MTDARCERGWGPCGYMCGWDCNGACLAPTPAEVEALRAENARLREAIKATVEAPIPPGKHETTGGVVFVPVLAFAQLLAALENHDE